MPIEKPNNTEDWVSCDDGIHLIQMNENYSHYGWVFRKIEGGWPYSVRKATEHEMAHAKARQHLRAGAEQVAAQYQPAERHREGSTPALSISAWRPLTAPGQIQLGDWLSFTVAGKFICAQAREILSPGTSAEEVIYNRRQNHYFVTSMAIDGTSTHKGVLVAKANRKY